MSDLLKKLQSSHAALATVELGGVKLGLRILTEHDYQQAGLAALEVLEAASREDVNVATSELLESERSLQLIALAVVDPANRQPIFDSADTARSSLTRAQKSLLIEAYLEHEREYSPRPENLSEAEFNELLDSLKKSAVKPSLNGLNGATLKKLVLSLAEQPST